MKDASRSPAESVHTVDVPREIVNADSVYVVSWAVADGDRVEAAAALCDIETSKAVMTVESPLAGYARPVAAVGCEVSVGGLLGYVTPRPDTPLPQASPAPAAASRAGAVENAGGPSATRISALARRKIVELGLNEDMFAGRAVVRVEDVIAAAARETDRPAEPAVPPNARASASAGPAADDPRGPSVTRAMGPIQRRVARAMTQSMAIPTSSLERIVDLAAARARAQTLSAESKVVVTEVDLLVYAVALACLEFPEFNGYAGADQQLCVFEKINVGVAVDVAGDLYVVVVRHAAAKSPDAVARELRTLQYLAARQRLGVEHVSGGTVTVTTMLGRGVTRFVPIPYPEQAAIVGLADVEPGTTKAALGLVFDHRVANGQRAAGFLAAIAAKLE